MVALGLRVGRLGRVAGWVALHLDRSWVAALSVHIQLYNEWEFVSHPLKYPHLIAVPPNLPHSST